MKKKKLISLWEKQNIIINNDNNSHSSHTQDDSEAVSGGRSSRLPFPHWLPKTKKRAHHNKKLWRSWLFYEKAENKRQLLRRSSHANPNYLQAERDRSWILSHEVENFFTIKNYLKIHEKEIFKKFKFETIFMNNFIKGEKEVASEWDGDIYWMFSLMITRSIMENRRKDELLFVEKRPPDWMYP